MRGKVARSRRDETTVRSNLRILGRSLSLRGESGGRIRGDWPEGSQGPQRTSLCADGRLAEFICNQAFAIFLRLKISEWLTANIFSDQKVETKKVSPIVISPAD
jgi:hypothetical protein